MKKGLSPLIAMVLAIAFVAAILAMVMSWILTHRPNVAMCEGLDTSLSYACRDGDTILFEIRNGADISIEAITVTSDGQDTMKEGIPSNGFADYTVPAPEGGELTVTPVLGKNQEIICADHKLEVPVGALEAC